MEDRTLPSVVVATTTNDLVNEIVAANNGTGPTTILLQAADSTNGFDFTSAYNSTNNALPAITANITIEGSRSFQPFLSADGTQWTPLYGPVGLFGPPAKLTIGLAAYSTSTERSEVRFDQFKFFRGARK